MSLSIIILAAGKSTRMNSKVSKILHNIAGKSIIEYCIDASKNLILDQIFLVTNPEMQDVRDYISNKYPNIVHAIQKKPLGTGDAIKPVLPLINNSLGHSIIIYGDTPFISSNTLINTYKQMKNNNSSICLVGFNCHKPHNYGRIIQDKNEKVLKVVEDANATLDEKKITFCTSGVIGVSNKYLPDLIKSIEPNTLKGEYYLFEIIPKALEDNLVCDAITCSEEEVLGINNRFELLEAQELMQKNLQKKFINKGVNLIKPDSIIFNFDTDIEADATIEPYVVFGANVKIESGAHIKSFSYLEGAHILSNAVVGPYARIRPRTVIEENCKVGNFVEIKNSTLKSGSKANHLSYIGDANVGYKTNIGAGVITCNYDGYAYKYKTIIGNNVSIGSNSSLIAPIEVKDDAMIAAGSVITKLVEQNSLAITRAKQVNLINMANTIRSKKKKE